MLRYIVDAAIFCKRILTHVLMMRDASYRGRRKSLGRPAMPNAKLKSL